MERRFVSVERHRTFSGSEEWPLNSGVLNAVQKHDIKIQWLIYTDDAYHWSTLAICKVASRLYGLFTSFNPGIG